MEAAYHWNLWLLLSILSRGTLTICLPVCRRLPCVGGRSLSGLGCGLSMWLTEIFWRGWCRCSIMSLRLTSRLNLRRWLRLLLSCLWLACDLTRWMPRVWLLVLKLMILVSFAWAGDHVLRLGIRVGARPLLEENLSIGLLIGLAWVHGGRERLLLLQRILFWMLLRECDTSAWCNYWSIHWNLRIYHLCCVVHCPSRCHHTSLMMSLSLLAVDLRGHCLWCLSLCLLWGVNLVSSVCIVGSVLSWPERDAWDAYGGSRGSPSKSVVARLARVAYPHSCGRRILASSSWSLIRYLLAMWLAARSRLSLCGRLRTIGCCRPTLGEHRVGCLLMLALLLGPVLLRVVLALLVEFQPLLAAAADLLGSLLLKMQLHCASSAWTWRGEELLLCIAGWRVRTLSSLSSTIAFAWMRILGVRGIHRRFRLPKELLLVDEVWVVWISSWGILVRSVAFMLVAWSRRGKGLQWVGAGGA